METVKAFDETYLCAVLIRGGNSILPIQNAIRSCIRNAKYIKSIFIENRIFDESQESYPGWYQDLETLKKLKLEPIWTTEFDPSMLKDSTAIIEMNPCQQIQESAFVKLYHRMTMSAPGYDHYAMSSGIEINISKYSHSDWISLFGFALSFFFWVMDGYRYLLNFGGYQRWSDLKIHTVIRTFPNKIAISPYKSFRWLLFTGVDYCLPHGEDNLQVVDNVNGFAFTHEYIRTDPNLSFRKGIRWVFLYLAMLGFYTHSIWTAPYWLGWWYSPVGSLTLIRWVVFGIYGIQVTQVLVVTFVIIYKFPYYMSGILCFLFPILALLSPLVLLLSKLFTIRSSVQFKDLSSKKTQ
jgi:hypothetical protein